MYSNCSQLSYFIQSRQGVTGVPKKYFGTCLNTDINDRMRKTKKTLCSACIRRALIWTLCMEVCLPLCMEESLFWLPQDDMTMDVDICSKWLNGNYCSLGYCFIADDGIYHHEILAGGTAEVQNLGFCSLTVPQPKRTNRPSSQFSWPLVT